MNKVKSILLVEDCNISNFLTINILEKMNIADRIVCLKNGAEAIHYLKACRAKKKQLPEIIILDIKMPVMNGFEFLDKYKDYAFHDSQTVIVMLTTSSEVTDMAKAKERGIQIFLNKPLTQEEITEVIDSYFKSMELRIVNECPFKKPLQSSYNI